MDAQPGLARRLFDAVVAPYVITAVPDPEATLDELARVTRGGEVMLVNHRAETGPRRLRARLRGRRGVSAGGRNSPGDGWHDGPGTRRSARGRAPSDAALGHFSLIRFGRRAESTDSQGRPTADAPPYARGGAG